MTFFYPTRYQHYTLVKDGWLYIRIQTLNFRQDTHTVCPRSSDPFYIVTFSIKWVTTSWTYIDFFISILKLLCVNTLILIGRKKNCNCVWKIRNFVEVENVNIYVHRWQHRIQIFSPYICYDQLQYLNFDSKMINLLNFSIVYLQIQQIWFDNTKKAILSFFLNL